VLTLVPALVQTGEGGAREEIRDDGTVQGLSEPRTYPPDTDHKSDGVNAFAKPAINIFICCCSAADTLSSLCLLPHSTMSTIFYLLFSQAVGREKKMKPSGIISHDKLPFLIF
jgi:hypothetical protein